MLIKHRIEATFRISYSFQHPGQCAMVPAIFYFQTSLKNILIQRLAILVHLNCLFICFRELKKFTLIKIVILGHATILYVFLTYEFCVSVQAEIFRTQSIVNPQIDELRAQRWKVRHFSSMQYDATTQRSLLTTFYQAQGIRQTLNYLFFRFFQRRCRGYFSKPICRFRGMYINKKRSHKQYSHPRNSL